MKPTVVVSTSNGVAASACGGVSAYKEILCLKIWSNGCSKTKVQECGWKAIECVWVLHCGCIGVLKTLSLKFQRFVIVVFIQNMEICMFDEPPSCVDEKHRLKLLAPNN